MKNLFSLAAFVLLALAPCTALSQSTPMPLSMIGVGAHGLDFLIGTWSCTNSMPSAVAGPATLSWTFGGTAVSGALSFHATGKNFDYTGYLAYDPRTKTWLNPIAYTNADYSAESSQETGQKIVFEGPYFTAASKFAKHQIRDTVTFVSLTKISDVGASLTGGTWKTSWDLTCTKS